ETRLPNVVAVHRPAGSEGRGGTNGGQDGREPLHTLDLLLGWIRAYRRPAPRQSRRHRTTVAWADVRPCPVLPAVEGRRPPSPRLRRLGGVGGDPTRGMPGS